MDDWTNELSTINKCTNKSLETAGGGNKLTRGKLAEYRKHVYDVSMTILIMNRTHLNIETSINHCVSFSTHSTNNSTFKFGKISEIHNNK